MLTNIQRNHPRVGWLSSVSLAVLVLVAACDLNETRSSAPGPNAAKGTSKPANQASQRVDKADDAVATKTKDAAITTKVNTLLGRDNELNALKIDVDTNAGRVVLQGTAPNDAARLRATDLARSVGGVVEVDNKLRVTAAK